MPSSKTAFQLLGGRPVSGTQRYQSCLGASLAERASANQGCSSELWFTTMSSTILMPRRLASADRRSKSSSVPNMGSTPR